jgi:hypothetical protein
MHTNFILLIKYVHISIGKNIVYNMHKSEFQLRYNHLFIYSNKFDQKKYEIHHCGSEFCHLIYKREKNRSEALIINYYDGGDA